MLASSRLPPRPKTKSTTKQQTASYARRRYEGDITANPLLEPVLAIGYPENVGQLEDEKVLNTGGYFLDEGPILNRLGYLHEEGLYSLGVSDDPSDVQRVDELNEIPTGRNEVYNDEKLRLRRAEFKVVGTGHSYDYRREYTDPANLVYNPSRDVLSSSQESTLIILPLFMGDSDVADELSVYLDDPNLIATIYEQASIIYNIQDYNIDTIWLYVPDEEPRRIENFDPEKLPVELVKPNVYLEVVSL